MLVDPNGSPCIFISSLTSSLNSSLLISTKWFVMPIFLETIFDHLASFIELFSAAYVKDWILKLKDF